MKFPYEDNAITRLGWILLSAFFGFFAANLVCWSLLVWLWPQGNFG